MSKSHQITMHLACIASQAVSGHWSRLAFHWNGIRRALAGI